MNGKFFLDTNILVYTFDSTSPLKKERAYELVNQAIVGQRGVISFQVVQEFLNVAIRKFARPLSTRDCDAYLDRVLTPLCEVFPDMNFYAKGLELAERYKYSFYDSLIIAAALEAECETLYSEDFQHGQVIRNMTIVDPFENINNTLACLDI